MPGVPKQVLTHARATTGLTLLGGLAIVLVADGDTWARVFQRLCIV